jgi:hypothetical protein
VRLPIFPQCCLAADSGHVLFFVLTNCVEYIALTYFCIVTEGSSLQSISVLSRVLNVAVVCLGIIHPPVFN